MGISGNNLALIAAGALVIVVIAALGFMLLQGGEEAPMAKEMPAEVPVMEEPAKEMKEMEEMPVMEEMEEVAEAEVGPEVGMIAPDFTLEAVDGTKFSLSDYRGKVVLLWFMIPKGCPICASQVEDLKRIYEEFGDQVVVIAVTLLDYEGVEKDMMEFAENRGRPEWIYAVDTVGLGIEYNIIEMGVIVIGPDGKIVHRGIPMVDYEELKSLIEPLIAQ